MVHSPTQSDTSSQPVVAPEAKDEVVQAEGEKSNPCATQACDLQHNHHLVKQAQKAHDGANDADQIIGHCELVDAKVDAKEAKQKRRIDRSDRAYGILENRISNGDAAGAYAAAERMVEHGAKNPAIGEILKARDDASYAIALQASEKKSLT